MSLFSSLFRYKESERRSPREDFLTEALCYLLNELDKTGHTGTALERFFNLRVEVGAKLAWRTQYYIDVPDGIMKGKRPDLVGKGEIDGKPAFVIVENKIGAGLTWYTDEETGVEANQLKIYRDYLNQRSEQRKHLVLLTYLTPRPDDWLEDQTISWTKVRKELVAWAERIDSPVASMIARELRVFLEEVGMAPIKMSLSDIAAAGAWRRLKNAFSVLGTEAALALVNDPAIRSTFEKAGMARTVSRAAGELAPDAFYGVVVSPVAASDEKSKKVDLSAVLFWMGVLTGVSEPIFEVIETKKPEVPELICAFGAWVSKSKLEDGRVFEEFHRICSKLNGGKTGSWEVTRRNNPGSDVPEDVILTCGTRVVPRYLSRSQGGRVGRAGSGVLSRTTAGDNRTQFRRYPFHSRFG